MINGVAVGTLQVQDGPAMEFTYECDETDGLILIDKYYLREFNDELLWELDILLDRCGKSELVYDFPDERWEDVQKRETKEIVDFCNSGKMVIFLQNEDKESHKINVKSGELLLISIGELIQCLTYPDLEMEALLEIDGLDISVYSVSFWNKESQLHILLRYEDSFGKTDDLYS